MYPDGAVTAGSGEDTDGDTGDAAGSDEPEDTDGAVFAVMAWPDVDAEVEDGPEVGAEVGAEVGPLPSESMQITAGLFPASETARCKAAVSLTRLVHGTCDVDPPEAGAEVGTEALIPGGNADAARLPAARLPQPLPVAGVDVLGEALPPEAAGEVVEPVGQPAALDWLAPVGAASEVVLELSSESFFLELLSDFL